MTATTVVIVYIMTLFTGGVALFFFASSLPPHDKNRQLLEAVAALLFSVIYATITMLMPTAVGKVATAILFLLFFCYGLSLFRRALH